MSTLRRGIFETVYQRATLREQFGALKADGFDSVQFDWESAGVDPWQHPIDAGKVESVRLDAEETGVVIPAISGTYNMAHPDEALRQTGHAGLVRVIESAPALAAPFVTLCTGTRTESSMWVAHPDNSTQGAWNDAQESIRRALDVAEANGVTLVVEPEPANVVASARLARRMLDEIASPALKIVLDPANIVLSDRTRDPADVLSEAFDLLGPDIVFAHAKDLSASGKFCAAGTGIVPWDLYRQLLAGIGYSGDIIFHTLTEADVPRAREVFS